MRTRFIAASLAATLTAFSGAGFGAQTATTAPALDTPTGITFADVTGSDSRFLWRYFTATSGKPLYTFDADGTAGKATCVDQCAQEFSPYLAPAGAVVNGDWSVTAAEPKQRQYAYKGHPLYVFSGKDPVPNTFRYYADNDKAAAFDPAMMDPSSKLFSPKEGWRRAAFTPEQVASAPSGIQLKSMAVANGYGFVDKSTGMPLYVMKTAPKNPRAWMPLYAPDLADRVGDFSIVVREDGKRQWGYKGQALYSYTGDYSPDDLNGLLAQGDVRPALAFQNFMPSTVRIEIVPFRGPMMVTTQGLTLYAQSQGRRYSNRVSYRDAKAIGTRGCVDDCLQSWRPLSAGPRDVASGFWDIYDRPDGSRQWAYKGGALYTYVGDKRLGDIEGDNREVIVYGDADGKNYDEVSLAGGNRGPDFRPYAGAGFHWHLIGFYD